MVFKSTLLLSFALVQMALATTVTIVSPKAKDVWHAGQVVEFKWTGEATPVQTGNSTHQKSTNKKHHKNNMLSIALATGPAQSLVIDRVIASNVNITKGSYKWKIPKNINTTKKYVIEIGPNASDIAFAGYVTIKAPQHINGTASSSHPTKTTVPVKPTHTVVTTSTPTSKHEPTSVCVAVPNKNGVGSTVKCHPQPEKSHSKKKSASPKSTDKKPASKSHTTKPASSSKSHHPHSSKSASSTAAPTI